MSSIYNIVAPTLTPTGNADTASYLKGDAETNTISSNGNANIQFNNKIAFNAGLSSPQLIGTSSWTNNVVPSTQFITASNASNAINSVNSQTASFLNYIGPSSNTGTASYAMIAKTVAGVTNNTFAFGSYYYLNGGPNPAGNVLTAAVSNNISSVKTLGILTYSTGDGNNKRPAFGVKFSSPVNSTNYMIVGTAWEYSANDAEFGVLFIPHTGGNKTTTEFTMSLLGGLLTGGVFYTNFQVLGY